MDKNSTKKTEREIWIDKHLSELLKGLKPMGPNSKIFKFFQPNPQQKIPEK
jgi:hypothetical protein